MTLVSVHMGNDFDVDDVDDVVDVDNRNPVKIFSISSSSLKLCSPIKYSHSISESADEMVRKSDVGSKAGFSCWKM